METALIPGNTQETAITGLLQLKGLTNCTTTEIIKSLCVPNPEKNLTVVASDISDLEVFKPGGGTQVSKIRKELGEKNLNTLLATLIFDLAGFYNIGGNITPIQVQNIVEVIKTDFWFLKIEQIVRAFHLQKTQNICTIYNRLDPGVITQILNTYDVMFNETCTDNAKALQEEYDSKRSCNDRKDEIKKFQAASMQYNFENQKKQNDNSNL